MKIKIKSNIIAIFFLLFSHVPLVVFLDFRISIALIIVLLSLLFPYKVRQKIKLLLILSSIIIIFSCYGFRLLGLRPGASLLVLMLGLKLYEINTKRDNYLFLFLTSFLPISLALFEQSIWVGIYLLAFIYFFILLLYITTISPNHQPINPKICTLIFFQSIPLVIILFLFFPRLPSAFIGLADSSSGISGLSSEISPGDFTNLVFSQKVAFRVKFVKHPKNTSNMYFRCAVYSKKQGSSWTIYTNKKIDSIPIAPLNNRSLTYTIYLEPLGNKFVPFLEMAVKRPNIAHVSLIQGNFFMLKKNITNPISYKLTSILSYNLHSISQKELLENLVIDWSQNPKTQQLAQNLLKQNTSIKGLLHNIINFFQKGFKYTLDPPPWPLKNPIDFFLFSSKQGFCEHYAVAAVTILRYAHIPARIVGGYRGGEINPLGEYLLVRNSNAHAWVELYDKTLGWIRFDPTLYIPIKNRDTAISQLKKIYYKWPIPNFIAKKIIHLWDYVSYKWNKWIIGYSSKTQHSIFSNLGLEFINKNIFSFCILLIVFIMLITIGILFLFITNTKHKDEIFRYYLKFLKKLEKNGITIKPSFGPQDIKYILKKQNPSLYKKANYIIELYIKIRYTNNFELRDVKKFKKKVRSF